MFLRFMCHPRVCKFLALFHSLRWVLACAAVVIAGFLVGLLGVSVIENADARDQAEASVARALDESEVQRRLSARRIDRLIDQNSEQSAQMGELREDVRLLREQLSLVGQTPIVGPDREVAPTSPSGGRAESPEVPGGQPRTEQPEPTPTPTTTPAPEPPPPSCTVQVLNVCVGS